MRIAIDCRSVFSGRGGIGRYAENLIKTIPSESSEQFITFTTERQKEQINPEVAQRVLPVGMIDPIWEQLHLPNEINEFEIDLYHNPCFALPIAQSRSKLVTTIHDVVFEERPDLVPEGLREYLCQWTKVATQIADLMITVSHYSKRKIIEYYNIEPSKVEVIYNGVESKFYPRSRQEQSKLIQKYQLPSNFILYLGSIEKKKNLTTLLEAYKNLKGESYLVLAGSKLPSDRSLEAFITANKLKDKVKILGYVPEEDIAPLLSSAKVFVYPSLYEGFGLPPLESMACGTPVIVSDSTSLPEVVDEAGLIFSTLSSENLLEKIRQLENKTFYSSMVSKGIKRAKSFTWQQCAKDTIAAYQKVM